MNMRSSDKGSFDGGPLPFEVSLGRVTTDAGASRASHWPWQLEGSIGDGSLWLVRCRPLSYRYTGPLIDCLHCSRVS